ncbi:hypothetical protein [Saccharothrix variisporea]|uniref:DUF4383 domain-containing protein n=1 Tax=Saccharothrix variisporea TaxID=543527 RepID=A0A495XL10_9PSEU|nr:hypothetical protein [Saccharothrix variisporea]RKT73564.1 hypothetical protein DFJ66_6901 [Saccharothrix variisporea]
MANLSWPQRAALAFGTVLLAWGVVDLVAAGRVALGVLHVITGAVVFASAFRVRAERMVGTLMGLVFLVVFVFGAGEPGGALDAGLIGNGAHLLLGFASVAIAESCVWCEQRARQRLP